MNVDGLTDDAIEAILCPDRMRLADIVAACMTCMRWARIGGHVLAVARRLEAERARALGGLCEHWFAAQGAVTHALALDSRPRLIRVLDVGLLGVHDSISLHGIVSKVDLTGIIPLRAHPDQLSDAFIDHVELSRSSPLVELAAAYGACACFDLLYERGARVDPCRIDKLIEEYLVECAWRGTGILHATKRPDERPIHILDDGLRVVASETDTRFRDPESMVRRLIGALPLLEESTVRETRGSVHPLLALVHGAIDALEDNDDRSQIMDCPRAADVARVARLFIDAGYRFDTSHPFGFGHGRCGIDARRVKGETYSETVIRIEQTPVRGHIIRLCAGGGDFGAALSKALFGA